MVQRKLFVNNACRLLIIWKSRQLFCSERWYREQRCSVFLPATDIFLLPCHVFCTPPGTTITVVLYCSNLWNGQINQTKCSLLLSALECNSDTMWCPVRQKLPFIVDCRWSTYSDILGLKFSPESGYPVVVFKSVHRVWYLNIILQNSLRLLRVVFFSVRPAK
jgi:hypothetical protein